MDASAARPLGIAPPLDAVAQKPHRIQPVYITSNSARRPVMREREAMDRAQELVADGIAQQGRPPSGLFAVLASWR